VESYYNHTEQMKVPAKTATVPGTTLWTRDSMNPPQTTFTSVTLDLSALRSARTQIRFSSTGSIATRATTPVGPSTTWSCRLWRPAERGRYE